MRQAIESGIQALNVTETSKKVVPYLKEIDYIIYINKL
jgi:hypothetical protein